jgi:hypothetical protein
MQHDAHARGKRRMHLALSIVCFSHVCGSARISLVLSVSSRGTWWCESSLAFCPVRVNVFGTKYVVARMYLSIYITQCVDNRACWSIKTYTIRYGKYSKIRRNSCRHMIERRHVHVQAHD